MQYYTEEHAEFLRSMGFKRYDNGWAWYHPSIGKGTEFDFTDNDKRGAFQEIWGVAQTKKCKDIKRELGIH